MLIFLKSTGKTLLYLTTLLCTTAIHAQPAFSDPVQQAYLKASNTGANDSFGHALAFSADGNTLAVTALFESSSATGVNGDENDNNAFAAGAVYIFVRNGLTWTQQAYIKADNTEANDRFGQALSLSADGHTLAVGASTEDSHPQGIGGGNNNGAAESGAVYIFTRSGNSWSQQAFIKASNAGAGDHFGYALVLSGDGNTLAVGASGEDSKAIGVNPAGFVLTQTGQYNNEAVDAGAVYVFRRSGGAWSQSDYLKASNTNAGDRFGHALALSGDGQTLAVGAFAEASAATGVNSVQINNSAVDAGAVYVFTRDNTPTWSQQAYIKASNTDAGDRFAWSLAIANDGDTLAVGAHREDSNAIGVAGNDNNDSHDAGAAYVFSRDNNLWTQQAYVKAANTNGNDYFGKALTLSGDGNVLAVGAYGENSSATGINDPHGIATEQNSGAAYTFARDALGWHFRDYLKAANTGEQDLFGTALAFSDNGKTLAIGAVQEDSNTTDVNGDDNDLSFNAGAVYVFASLVGVLFSDSFE